MSNFKELMGELLELGMTANPASPYAACLIDGSGQILVTTCNAVHISPLYTAEALAIHIIASEFDCHSDQPLTLVATAEIDESSLQALYRARRRGINVSELVSGASRADIKSIWTSDTNRPAQETLKQFPVAFRNSITLHDPVLQDDCREAFTEGRAVLDDGQVPIKSLNIDEYWMLGDWQLDDWETLEMND
ncbi:hypothetical protein ACH42_01475 [Endozoicomonas sp. (ex Bugula neritina AB1)]|nr:hypothetical protein ACH42_01475 [Endozoicomonas sp. (ex Bugula neritina AB1)]